MARIYTVLFSEVSLAVSGLTSSCGLEGSAQSVLVLLLQLWESARVLLPVQDGHSSLVDHKSSSH